MNKILDENARERLQTLKEDIADYTGRLNDSKVALVNARKDLQEEEVNWAKAVIALEEFKTEYGL